MNDARGFTLIEILLVMGVIAAVLAMVAVPNNTRRNSEMRTAVRKLSVLSRQIHNYAKLQNVNYRMVIDMGDEIDSNKPHSFWVELSTEDVTFANEESLGAQREEELRDSEKAKNGGFQPALKILRRPETLPGGLYFESIELGNMDTPVTSGRAYINYLKQGLVEEAIIRIKHREAENLEWSVAIHPLTGKADIIPQRVTLDDLRQ